MESQSSGGSTVSSLIIVPKNYSNVYSRYLNYIVNFPAWRKGAKQTKHEKLIIQINYRDNHINYLNKTQSFLNIQFTFLKSITLSETDELCFIIHLFALKPLILYAESKKDRTALSQEIKHILDNQQYLKESSEPLQTVRIDHSEIFDL